MNKSQLISSWLITAAVGISTFSPKLFAIEQDNTEPKKLDCPTILEARADKFVVSIPVTADDKQAQELKNTAKVALLEKQVSCLLQIDSVKRSTQQQEQLNQWSLQLASMLPRKSVQPAMLTESCELDPKANVTILSAKTLDEWNNQSKTSELRKVNAQLACLLAKSELNAEQQKKLSALVKQQNDTLNPTGEAQEVGRIISSFELGAMKLPDYSDGENHGFSNTKLYFDSRIDGRFHFDQIGLVLNSYFDASFYGSGTVSESKSAGTTASPMEDSPTIPTKFNDVSDTLDASFSLRFSAYQCSPEKGLFSTLTCLSADKDSLSSFGPTLTYGFLNKDKKLDDEDTINVYKAVGFEYRYYRKKIALNSNGVPDFVVSFQRAKFEQYGLITKSADCLEPPECLTPRQNVYRFLFKLNYRLVSDKPYFLGFRMNSGVGPDEYGLTIGIRKTGNDILNILGITE